jgi:hypothetical protein
MEWAIASTLGQMFSFTSSGDKVAGAARAAAAKIRAVIISILPVSIVAMRVLVV